jgi:hypothetical protein
MKKLLYLTFSVMLSLLATQHAKADGYDLYIIALDGTTYTSLNYANLRSLTFSQSREDNGAGTKVYVNRMSANYKDGSNKVFDLKDYSAIKFDDYAVAIEDISLDGVATAPLKFDGSIITPLRNGRMTVYQLDGRLVGSFRAEAGKAVDIHHLTSGAYIINLGGQTSKILVK